MSWKRRPSCTLMPKVIWDSSQICKQVLHFQGQNQLDPSVSGILFFFFLSHLAVLLLAPPVRSLSSFTGVSLYQTSCVGASLLSPQSFSVVFLWTTTLPFSTTNDAFFCLICSFCEYWPIQQLYFSLLPAWPFFILSTSCFQIFACSSSLSSLVFRLTLYFSSLVCPTLPVHVSYVSFCHFWENQTHS